MGPFCKVNARNKSKNTRVDADDSRATLAEEFTGTGDAANETFRRTRTKMVDLWSTKVEDEEGGGGDEDAAAANAKVENKGAGVRGGE